MNDPLRQWQYATVKRVEFAIRDWQKANRIVLSKEAAADLLDRFASAMADAVQFGQRTAPKEEPNGAEDHRSVPGAAEP